MCPIDRRAHERAMHETFLVIRTGPNDMGSRPATGSFTSPDVTIGPDGRPRAVVWNLGTREVKGVVTEFATIAAGMPIHQDHKKVIGYGNPANIPANSSVTVACTAVWHRMSHADLLLVTAHHPELDPVKAPCDPMMDRHVGQMNYPWAGTFEGHCPGPNGGRLQIQVRPANQGLFKVRVFQAVNGRIPSNPQIDRPMAPTGSAFRWQQSYSFKKEDWELVMLDNGKVAVKSRTRFTDQSGRPNYDLTGTLLRA